MNRAAQDQAFTVARLMARNTPNSTDSELNEVAEALVDLIRAVTRDGLVVGNTKTCNICGFRQRYDTESHYCTGIPMPSK